MTIRIGTNPIGWSNDDLPELGGDTPLETCLAEAKTAGYAGLELGHKFPRDPAALRPILAAHDVDLISGWYSGGLLTRDVGAEIAAMTPHLDLLAAMDCQVMVFCETTGCIHGARGMPLSARPVMTEAEWRRLGTGLTELAEYTLKRGVRIAYHHHMGTVIQSAAEIDRLMAETGQAVGLLLDTGHATYAGADALDLARRHVGRIAHVHCKDVRPARLGEALAGDWSFLDAVVSGVFTVPGDGAIDYAPIFKVLAGAGYDGWLVVEAEQDPAKANPLAYATKGYQYLARVARETGLMAA